MKILTRLKKYVVFIHAASWFFIVSDINAQEMLTVTGTCMASGPSQLIIFLVDEKQFSVPMSGTQLRIPLVPESSGGERVFSFSLRVPAGRYGLRCFLDMNGNGTLDRGLFGPAEPWGMKWQGRRPFGFPSFDHIAFWVKRDTVCPIIILGK